MAAARLTPCTPSPSSSSAASLTTPAFVTGASPSHGAAPPLSVAGVLFKQRDLALSLEAGWRPRHFYLDAPSRLLYYGLVAQRPGALARGRLELARLARPAELFEPVLMAAGGLELWPFTVGPWRLAASSCEDRRRWLRALAGASDLADEEEIEVGVETPAGAPAPSLGSPAAPPSTSPHLRAHAGSALPVPSPASQGEERLPVHTPAPPGASPAPAASDARAHSAALDRAAMLLLALIEGSGQLPRALAEGDAQMCCSDGPRPIGAAVSAARRAEWQSLDHAGAPADGPRRLAVVRAHGCASRLLAVGTSGERGSDAIEDGMWECAAYAADPAHWAAYDEHLDDARPVAAVRCGAARAACDSTPGIVTVCSYKRVPLLLSARAFAVVTAVRELRAGAPTDRSSGDARFETSGGTRQQGKLVGVLAFATSVSPVLRRADGPAARALGALVRAGAVEGELHVGGWLITPARDGGGVQLAYALDLDLTGSPPAFVCVEAARAQASCAVRMAALARRNAALRPALARELPRAPHGWFTEQIDALVATAQLPAIELDASGAPARRAGGADGGDDGPALSLIHI